MAPKCSYDEVEEFKGFILQIIAVKNKTLQRLEILVFNQAAAMYILA